MDDKVSEYIEKVQPWQTTLCKGLREMVHETIPDVEERLQYGKPHFLKNGSYAAVISVATRRRVRYKVP